MFAMSSRKESKFYDDSDDDDLYNAKHTYRPDQKGLANNHNPPPPSENPVWMNSYLSREQNLSKFIKLEKEKVTTSSSSFTIPRTIKQEKNADPVTTMTIVKQESQSNRIVNVNVDMFPKGINNLISAPKNKIKVEKTVVAETSTSSTFGVKLERTSSAPSESLIFRRNSYSGQSTDVKPTTVPTSRTLLVKSNSTGPTPFFRSTKFTDPSPLPQRIQDKQTRRSSLQQNMTDSERETGRRRRYDSGNRLGYEGRRHHRHAHQAERQKVFERYKYGQAEEDSDDEDNYYNVD